MSEACRCEPCPDCGYKHYCNVAVDHKEQIRAGECEPPPDHRVCILCVEGTYLTGHVTPVEHCVKCGQPWPCEVAALTTRLAEMEQKESDHRTYLISCPWCGEAMNARAVSQQFMHVIGCGDKRNADAETRLAEVERERDEAVDQRKKLLEEVLPDIGDKLGKSLGLLQSATERAESAEQLLSEMAEGLREAVRGDTDRMKWSAILAKYDSRNAEAR